MIPVPSLDELAAHPEMVPELSAETAAALYSKVRHTEAALLARLLLERPTVGLDPVEAQALLGAARRLADRGSAVVLTADDPELVTGHATTLAVLVAGRLVSWGAPPVARVPAVHILSVAQAGSIITSSM